MIHGVEGPEMAHTLIPKHFEVFLHSGNIGIGNISLIQVFQLGHVRNSVRK
jgi:hypothetical protein